jgi:hypothetical protein
MLDRRRQMTVVRRAQDDPEAKDVLSHNLVKCFRDYHDIRFMSSVSGEAELLTNQVAEKAT